MSFILFNAPPIPHFIACGEDTYTLGQSHPRRKNIGVFDLLIITEGELKIGEENQHWFLQPGQVLLLRPDRSHYPIEECKSKTHFFWIHFQTTGEWQETAGSLTNQSTDKRNPFKPILHFHIILPRKCQLSANLQLFEKIRNLIALEGQPLASSRWQQQILFQEVLLGLNAELQHLNTLSVSHIAERTSTFLRQNYSNPISYKLLGETLHFHPAYVARCMKHVFGCTPLEYLNRFRLEQAKRLLVNSNKTIGQVAEECGFEQISYFIRCFTKSELVTPSKYRKRYRF